MKNTDDIIIQLRPLTSDRPVEVRLRQVLKALLRHQQFRCVRVSDATKSTQAAAEVKS